MSATTALSRKIVLRGNPLHDEGVAAGAIKPGQFVKLDSDGKYVVHATALGFGEKIIAVEDALQGKTINDAYAANDRVSVAILHPGCEVAAYINAGANGNIAIGDHLVPDGAGNLEETNGTPKEIWAVAREATDLNDTGDVDTRIRVRIL